jgi:hypothetical protein
MRTLYLTPIFNQPVLHLGDDNVSLYDAQSVGYYWSSSPPQARGVWQISVIAAQRRPASTAALIHLLTSAPRKLHDWPAIRLAKPAIHLTLNHHELELAGPIAIEPNAARTKHIDIVTFPQLHLNDAPQAQKGLLHRWRPSSSSNWLAFSTI